MTPEREAEIREHVKDSADPCETQQAIYELLTEVDRLRDVVKAIEQLALEDGHNIDSLKREVERLRPPEGLMLLHVERDISAPTEGELRIPFVCDLKELDMLSYRIVAAKDDSEKSIKNKHIGSTLESLYDEYELDKYGIPCDSCGYGALDKDGVCSSCHRLVCPECGKPE
jgi:hypothetical protein